MKRHHGLQQIGYKQHQARSVSKGLPAPGWDCRRIEQEGVMPNKNRLPSLEECFARFLAKQAPGLKHDVERAFRQWNNIVRDHLRSEMALRLTVGDDAQAVPVHIEEDDLPDAFAQVIQDTDEKTWVLLQHRGALRAAAKGTRVLRRDF